MGGSYEDIVHDFDLSFLRQNPNNELDPLTKYQRLKKNIHLMKKKAVQTGALIKNHEQKDNLITDLNKLLVATKDECQQIAIALNEASEKIKAYEQEIQRLQKLNQQWEQCALSYQSRHAALESHCNQLQSLVKEKEANAEAAKIEKNLDKNSVKNLKKNIAQLNKQRDLFMKHLYIFACVVFNKRKLSKKNITLLEIYKKPGVFDDCDDEFSGDEDEELLDFTEISENVNIGKQSPKNDNFKAENSEMRSVDTGRGSSITSPVDYFSDGPLTPEEHNTVCTATSPVAFAMVTSSRGPLSSNTDSLDSHTYMVDKAVSPIMIENGPQTYQNTDIELPSITNDVRDYKVDKAVSPIRFENEPNTSIRNDDGENKNEDWEVELILSNMQFHQDLITPIPSSPSVASRSLSTRFESCEVTIGSQGDDQNSDVLSMKQEILKLKKFLQSKHLVDEYNKSNANSSLLDAVASEKTESPRKSLNNDGVADTVSPVLSLNDENETNDTRDDGEDSDADNLVISLNDAQSNNVSEIQETSHKNTDGYLEKAQNTEYIDRTTEKKKEKQRKLTRLEKLRQKMIPTPKMQRNVAPKRLLRNQVKRLLPINKEQNTALIIETQEKTRAEAVRIWIQEKQKENKTAMETACKIFKKPNSFKVTPKTDDSPVKFQSSISPVSKDVSFSKPSLNSDFNTNCGVPKTMVKSSIDSLKNGIESDKCLVIVVERSCAIAQQLKNNILKSTKKKDEVETKLISKRILRNSPETSDKVETKIMSRRTLRNAPKKRNEVETKLIRKRILRNSSTQDTDSDISESETKMDNSKIRRRKRLRILSIEETESTNSNQDNTCIAPPTCITPHSNSKNLNLDWNKNLSLDSNTHNKILRSASAKDKILPSNLKKLKIESAKPKTRRRILRSSSSNEEQSEQSETKNNEDRKEVVKENMVPVRGDRPSKQLEEILMGQTRTLRSCKKRDPRISESSDVSGGGIEISEVIANPKRSRLSSDSKILNDTRCSSTCRSKYPVKKAQKIKSQDNTEVQLKRTLRSGGAQMSSLHTDETKKVKQSRIDSDHSRNFVPKIMDQEKRNLQSGSEHTHEDNKRISCKVASSTNKQKAKSMVTKSLVSYSDLQTFNDEPEMSERIEISTEVNTLQTKTDSKGDVEGSNNNVLCKMIGKYASRREEIKDIKKILPDVIATSVQKKIEASIAHILELRTPKDQTQAMNKFVEDILKMNEIQFIAGLMKYLSDPERKDELFNKDTVHPAPPLTKSEQVLLYILNKLKQIWPNIFNLVLSDIEYTLFRLNYTPGFGVIESMSHTYAVICRYIDCKSRLRLFLIAAMYCIQFKSFPLIKQCLEVWTHILPLAHMGMAQRPLVTCVIYLLHFYKCEDKFNRVQEIRRILTRNYFYKYTEWNESRILELFKSAVLDIKESPLEMKMLRLALIILAKRHGPQWCLQNLIHNMLIPIINDEKTPDRIKAFCVSVLGPLLKPYPREMKANCDVILNDLFDKLKKGNNSHQMMEAIYTSLIHMSKHNYNRVVEALVAWSAPCNTLSNDMREVLRDFVKEKSERQWKTVLSNVPMYL